MFSLMLFNMVWTTMDSLMWVYFMEHAQKAFEQVRELGLSPLSMMAFPTALSKAAAAFASARSWGAMLAAMFLGALGISNYALSALAGKTMSGAEAAGGAAAMGATDPSQRASALKGLAAAPTAMAAANTFGFGGMSGVEMINTMKQGAAANATSSAMGGFEAAGKRMGESNSIHDRTGVMTNEAVRDAVGGDLGKLADVSQKKVRSDVAHASSISNSQAALEGEFRGAETRAKGEISSDQHEANKRLDLAKAAAATNAASKEAQAEASGQQALASSVRAANLSRDEVALISATGAGTDVGRAGELGGFSGAKSIAANQQMLSNADLGAKLDVLGANPRSAAAEKSLVDAISTSSMASLIARGDTRIAELLTHENQAVREKALNTTAQLMSETQKLSGSDKHSMDANAAAKVGASTSASMEGGVRMTAGSAHTEETNLHRAQIANIINRAEEAHHLDPTDTRQQIAKDLHSYREVLAREVDSTDPNSHGLFAPIGAYDKAKQMFDSMGKP